jgi:hypothetical protein
MMAAAGSIRSRRKRGIVRVFAHWQPFSLSIYNTCLSVGGILENFVEITMGTAFFGE